MYFILVCASIFCSAGPAPEKNVVKRVRANDFTSTAGNSPFLH